MKLKVTVNQIPYEVEVEVDDTPEMLPIISIGDALERGKVVEVKKVLSKIESPLAGSVRRLFVEVDQIIVPGQLIAVLEAMKMETEMKAPFSGKITKIFVEPGDAVQGGDPMFEVDPEV